MTAPGVSERGLVADDWRAIQCFTQAEVAAACQDGAWTNLDAGSVYLLDAFAGYLVGEQRLLESVGFMPTKNGAGQPTATWNTVDTKAHAVDSMHYRGRAFDLMFPKSALATAWLTALRFPKWGGIGCYPGWAPDPGLHLDTRWTGASEQGPGFRVLWWANRRGVYHYLNSEVDIREFLGVLKDAA